MGFYEIILFLCEVIFLYIYKSRQGQQYIQISLRFGEPENAVIADFKASEAAYYLETVLVKANGLVAVLELLIRVPYTLPFWMRSVTCGSP